MKRICVLIAICLGMLTGCTTIQQNNIEAAQTRAVFAWEGVSDKDLTVLEKYSINTLYIDIFHFSSIPGYQCYLLVGDPSWELKDMEAAVDTAKKKGADGIIFDVEGDYEKLAGNLERLESSLPVAVCYPYWLDEKTEERIIKASSSSVVMNYYRSKEQEHLQDEMLLCKKYNKELITAYELQPVSAEIPESITYSGNMDAVLENYKQFTDIGIAFHHLDCIR